IADRLSFIAGARHLDIIEIDRRGLDLFSPLACEGDLAVRPPRGQDQRQAGESPTLPGAHRVLSPSDPDRSPDTVPGTPPLYSEGRRESPASRQTGPGTASARSYRAVATAIVGPMPTGRAGRPQSRPGPY